MRFFRNKNRIIFSKNLLNIPNCDCVSTMPELCSGCPHLNMSAHVNYLLRVWYFSNCFVLLHSAFRYVKRRSCYSIIY